MKNSWIIGIATLVLFSCDGTKDNGHKVDTAVVVPKTDYSKVLGFQADSAYAYIQKQVSFGPRIPNSKAHDACGEYLSAKFRSYGLTVQDQIFQSTGHDNAKLNGRNIIASYNPTASKRILISAHWDTRPWADEDPQNPKAKLDGANDGASGVGVILEMARLLSSATAKPAVGIDFILFDLEDYGKPSVGDSYCLGSQYWAKSRHLPNYSAYYGILLDMVGARGARFNKEGHSMNVAPSVVNRVWDTANESGYGEFFIHQMGGAITDDHYYVSKITGIPMIDIIEYDPNRGFGEYWHTQNDNMNVIDTRTLKAVGQTVMNVVYTEK